MTELERTDRQADPGGCEQVQPQLDDWIDVGVFGRAKSGEEADQPVLYMQRVHVTSGTPKLTVVVDEVPYEAGFDPYNKLIDRVSADNRKKVSM